MRYYKDKIAIVTGGASGIGRALSKELGRHGAVVTVTDIDVKGAKKVAEDIKSAGGKASAKRLDVTKADKVQEMVEVTASEHGRLDFMFNNAGIVVVAEFKDTLLEDWRRLIDINLLGVVNGMHAAYRLMINQGFGHIVNTASATGIAPTPLFSAYSAMKHAIVGLTTAAAAEGASFGVRVSAICPWIVDTPLFDTGNFRNVDRDKTTELVRNLTPEYTARVALRGVKKDKTIILVGLEGKVMYYSYRFFPHIYMWAGKIYVKRLRRQAGKK